VVCVVTDSAEEPGEPDRSEQSEPQQTVPPEAEPTQAEPTQAEREPEQPAAELPGRGLNRRIVAIAAAVLVLVGVGITVYFLTKDDSPAASPASGPAGASAAPASTPANNSPATSVPSQPSQGGAATPAEVGSAKAAAERAVQAFNAHDPEALKKVNCDPSAIGDAGDIIPPEAKVELVSAPELSGDTATVELKLTIGEQSTTVPLPLRKQDATWCVD
jgi:hypothetical protein